MSWRYQPPSAPPLPISAILSGVRAVGGRDAVRSVTAELRHFFGSRDVWLVDSGTSALTLAFLAVRAAFQGRPVALPAFSCYDLATAAVGADVPVALYDVDPATLAPDASSLRTVLEGGAAAVVAAPLFGLPVAMDAVQHLAAEFGAVVIEDAAQGTGASWMGRPIGAHGSIGILSFGRGKGVTAGGGGAVLLNTEEAVSLMAPVRERIRETGGDPLLLGKAAAQWALARPLLYRLPAAIPWLRLGETIYRDPHDPRWMGAAAAGILARTWTMVAGDTRRRRATAEYLDQAVRERDPNILPTLAPGSDPAYLRFPLVFPHPPTLSTADRHLGIARSYPTTLCTLPQLEPQLASTPPRFPGAQQLADCLVTLPTHRLLSPTDRSALTGWITERIGVRTPDRR